MCTSAGGWPTEKRRLRKLDIAGEVDTDDFAHVVRRHAAVGSFLCGVFVVTARLRAHSASPRDLALECGSCCSLLLPPAAAAVFSVNSSSCCGLSMHHPACCLLRCLRLDLRLLLPLPTKQGADAEGRTPLELIREGQVVRGTVVAQLLYHGAQVGLTLHSTALC